jgi:hypothetical protein
MMTEQQAQIVLNDLINSESYKSLSSEAKQQTLFNISKDISVDASGSTTILYSGNIDGQKTSDIAVAMAKADPSMRIINNTDAAQFLNSDNFKKAFYETAGINGKDYMDGLLFPEQKAIIKDLNDNKLYSSTGPWAEASKRFVQETKGRVIILIGKDADPKKIFGSIEFQELMKNKSVTHINNIPIDEFKKTLNFIPDQAITPTQIELLSESSSQILKTLNALKDKTTDVYNKKSKIDIESFETQMNKIESETIRFKNMLAEAMSKNSNHSTQESIKSVKDEETHICRHRRR